jgi:hypothetical protein
MRPLICVYTVFCETGHAWSVYRDEELLHEEAVEEPDDGA